MCRHFSHTIPQGLLVIADLLYISHFPLILFRSGLECTTTRVCTCVQWHSSLYTRPDDDDLTAMAQLFHSIVGNRSCLRNVMRTCCYISLSCVKLFYGLDE